MLFKNCDCICQPIDYVTRYQLDHAAFTREWYTQSGDDFYQGFRQKFVISWHEDNHDVRTYHLNYGKNNNSCSQSVVRTAAQLFRSRVHCPQCPVVQLTCIHTFWAFPRDIFITKADHLPYALWEYFCSSCTWDKTHTSTTLVTCMDNE